MTPRTLGHVRAWLVGRVLRVCGIAPIDGPHAVDTVARRIAAFASDIQPRHVSWTTYRSSAIEPDEIRIVVMVRD